METFTQTLVQGLVQALVLALVILAGVWAVLRKQFKPANGNGKCEKRLEACNAKFLEAANERAKVKTGLANLSGHLANIEEHIDARMDILEDKIDGKKPRRRK